MNNKLNLPVGGRLDGADGGVNRRGYCWGKAVRVTGAALWGACVLAGGGVPPVHSAEVFSDSGFVSELVTTLPAYTPVGVTWAPDGRMFIWQKDGIVRIFHDGALHTQPFLDFSAKVNRSYDNGMLGMAFDPNFASNGYVYLTYVYEPGSNPNDINPKTSRLVRVTANPNNPDVMLAGSEVILMGGMPISAAGTHSVGTIRFASDGTLFFGNGDGADPGYLDLIARSAQDLDSVRGKIFRINADGSAPADNPFYDGTDSNRSKVWCYGVRNPYRFSLHPVSGEPYIADVGWNYWEELDRGGRGKNLGWPYYEAGEISEYAGYMPAPDPANLVFPLRSYAHGTGDLGQSGTCLVGGDFYRGTQYPNLYRGNYFYMDYSGNWIHRLVLDSNGGYVSAAPFATGLAGPTCLEEGPDGLLYLVNLNSGQIRRIRYNGTTAVASANPSSGYSPLQVSFSSAGSTNSGGGSLTYAWNFGDGGTSTAANPTHTYVAAGVTNYTAQLTVQNTSGLSSSTTVKVTVGSLPPSPNIVSPANGAGYVPGQVITFQGSATDAEDGVIAASTLQWRVLLHHDTHVHVVASTTGAQGSFQVENHGTIGVFSYEILLTATDSTGLTGTTNVNLQVLVDNEPPTVPTALTATPGAGRVDLSWAAATDNGAVASYQIERSQGAGSTSFGVVGSATGTAYADAGLSGQTQYNYRLAAVDFSGNVGAYSGVVSATTLDPPPGAAGLVAAYGFNEGSGPTVSDASGNGITGTNNGAVWTLGGKYGGALSYNGTSSYVDLGNPPALQLTGSMTWSAWVKAAANPADDGQIVAKSDNTSGWQFKTSPDTGPHTFGVGVSGSASARTQRYSVTTRSLNVWYHVAGVYNAAARTLDIYVNGVLDNGTLVGTIPAAQVNSAVNVNIGRRTGGFYFDGVIDEVRIYNRALSAAEIQSDMNIPVGITKQTPTLTWENPPAITYGEALGGVQLNATASVSGTFVYSPASGAILNAGIGQVLSVTFTPTDTVYYNSATRTVSVTVNQAEAVVTTWPVAGAITYGQALTAAALGGGVATPAGSFAFTTPATVLTAGTSLESVTYTPSDTANYNPVSSAVSVTVTAAALTITAHDTNRVYGEANPGFSASYSGFVNGQDASVLGGTLGLSTVAGPASPAGTYAITPAGLSSTNYSLTFSNGTLTVTQRPITVTADAQSKDYGAADPALTYQVSSGTLFGTDSFSGGLSRVGGENVGDYAIQQDALSAGTNYALTYVGANLTIAKKELLAQADDKSRVFGQTNPVFTVTFSGFVGGEDMSKLGALPTASTLAQTNSPTGLYAIELAGGSDTNYSLVLSNGTLTVTTPASFRITTILRLLDNSIQIAGKGDTNVVYILQASDNLNDWQPIGAVATGETGVFQFDDLGATNQTSRFYRMVLP